MIRKSVTVLPDVLSRDVGGETVLLDLKSECYFGLDELGTRIWQLIQETSDLQKVHDILLNEYDVDGEQLEKDLEKIVEELVKAGLISISEE